MTAMCQAETPGTMTPPSELRNPKGGSMSMMLVEAAGVEPASENMSESASTCVACD